MITIRSNAWFGEEKNTLYIFPNLYDHVTDSENHLVIVENCSNLRFQIVLCEKLFDQLFPGGIRNPTLDDEQIVQSIFSSEFVG